MLQTRRPNCLAPSLWCLNLLPPCGYFPRIAGKPGGYLYNQSVAFRDGTRRYPPMNYLVAYLPDAYLREMAEHFSRLRPPFAAREQTQADGATLARGQALVIHGDPGRGIPACITCHGAGLSGMIPNQNWYAPSLTSNREAGLGNWSIKEISDLLQVGVSHRGTVYGPMAEVVYNSLQYLSDDDAQAMAVYLKALPQREAEAPHSSQARLVSPGPYRNGQRSSAVMQGLAKGLSDQDVRDLAAYYAYLPKARTAPTTYDESLPALVRVGAPLRNIAPCISSRRSRPEAGSALDRGHAEGIPGCGISTGIPHAANCSAMFCICCMPRSS